MIKLITLGLLILLVPMTVHAENKTQQSDIMRFETVVRGNEEQPKVIIIRPWQPISNTILSLPENKIDIPKRLFTDKRSQLIDP